MIRIVLRVIHMGVMLLVHPREDWKGKEQHESAAMSQSRIDPPIAMGGPMTRIMDHRAHHMQGRHVQQKANPARPVQGKVADRRTDRDQH